jgi:hypothetical protein
MRKHLAAILGITCTAAFLLSSFVHADDDPPKLVSLGLSAATAMASEKDVVKGLQTAAKDEYTSWMWDAIGGTEKFIFQNTEADLPGVKDKINNIISIVGQIEKFSIAMTEGKYDDAAFAAIDQVVGTVNHPLVSLTWEMAKLTYESHKAVQASSAALKVETLYGMMNNDRRLIGTVDPKSDAPPTIPETAASADYFFDKYVMTNDGARAALQAYVTTVLGEEWPEQSWSDWIGSFRALGSGVDTAKSAELEMLGSEWRNKGRTWIMKVIKEVNKMAKQAWAEARLRQQMVEFKKFADRVGHFYNGDFAQMLREFKAIKEVQADLPNYPQYLAKSQADRQKVLKQIGDLKPKDMGKVSGIMPMAQEWYYKCLSYSSRAGMLRDNGLAGSFMQERAQWNAVMDQLKRFMDAQKGQVVENAQDEISEELTEQYGNNDQARQQAQATAGYANQFFSEITRKYLLEELQWTFDVPGDLVDPQGQVIQLGSSPETLTQQLLDVCNRGDIVLAKGMLAVWENAARDHMKGWESPFTPVLDGRPELEAFVRQKEASQAAVDAVMKELEALGKARGALSQSLPRCPEKASWEQCSAIIASNNAKMRAFDARIPPIKARLWAVQGNNNAVLAGWEAAKAKARETAGRLVLMARTLFEENTARPREVVGAFEALADARKKEYAKLKETMDYLSATLPFDVDGIMQGLEEELKRMGEEAHTYLKPFREDNANPMNAFGILSILADQLNNEGCSPAGVLAQINHYEKLFDTWEQAADLWKASARLDDDDIQQMQVLVQPGFDLKEKVGKINKAAADVRTAPARIQGVLTRMLRLAETDRDNRDKDSVWLIERSREINRFFREQFDRKRLSHERGLAVVLPGVVEDGMLKVHEPYPHYLLQPEIDLVTKPVLDEYRASAAFAVMSKYLPDHHAAFLRLLTLPDVKGAEEGNFFVRNEVVYAKDLERAGEIIKKMSPTGKSYEEDLAEVAKLLPLMLNVTTDKERAYHERQAALYRMTMEEYQTKVLKRDISKPSYTMRDIDLAGEGLGTHPLGQKYLELREKLEQIVDEHRGAAIVARQQAAEASQREELRRRQEEENRRTIEAGKAANPLLYYGYEVLDLRVNSYPVNGVSGQVVVTKDKLAAGEIEITGRLNHVDKARTVLFSVDGGRTWQQISLSKDIRYAFRPVPNKPYQLQLKIKTVDMIDVVIGLLQGAEIVYQDENFTQEVLLALQTIADSYERQDFSAFSGLVARDFLGNKSTLEEGVRFDFDMFTDIRLKLYINRIEQRGDNFVAETRWDKAQTPRKTGEVQKTSGQTAMTFVLEDGRLKLKNLRGNLLYATLSPDIAQSSGLKSSIVDDVRTARDDRNPTQPGAGDTSDEGGLAAQTEAKTVTVTSPNGGENWGRGSTHAVTWSSTGISEVHIEYEEGPGLWFDIVASTSAAAGSYDWTIDPMIPAVAASQVRITAVEDATVTDTSDNTFSIF